MRERDLSVGSTPPLADERSWPGPSERLAAPPGLPLILKLVGAGELPAHLEDLAIGDLVGLPRVPPRGRR